MLARLRRNGSVVHNSAQHIRTCRAADPDKDWSDPMTEKPLLRTLEEVTTTCARRHSRAAAL